MVQTTSFRLFMINSIHRKKGLTKVYLLTFSSRHNETTLRFNEFLSINVLPGRMF